jgi:hypothetical protein
MPIDIMNLRAKGGEPDKWRKMMQDRFKVRLFTMSSFRDDCSSDFVLLAHRLCTQDVQLIEKVIELDEVRG